MKDVKKRVLFLCTANSARSQMAEGLTRALRGHDFEPFSAGSSPSFVNPYAIMAMQEIGIDISSQRSKSVQEFLGQQFDYVITLCDGARGSCPMLPGAGSVTHKGFPDPAAASGSPDDILSEFRKVRDMLRDLVLGLPGSLY